MSLNREIQKQKWAYSWQSFCKNHWVPLIEIFSNLFAVSSLEYSVHEQLKFSFFTKRIFVNDSFYKNQKFIFKTDNGKKSNLEYAKTVEMYLGKQTVDAVFCFPINSAAAYSAPEMCIVETSLSILLFNFYSTVCESCVHLPHRLLKN